MSEEAREEEYQSQPMPAEETLENTSEPTDSSAEASDAETAAQEAEARYHWDYKEQLDRERREERKKQKKGIVNYAISMVAVFLACLLLLSGVVIWYEKQTAKQDLAVTDIGAAAAMVSPSTVLIFADGFYGSGFFIRSDGYIATNYHVVGDADSITVRLYSGAELEARYVSGSPIDDLAIIKISGDNYPVAKIGQSSALSAGETAIIIGHPGGSDGAWSITSGIISSPHRIIQIPGNGYISEVTMIQTDAAVNQGNSGGPLCNTKGEVVGIVTRKLADYEAMGYAIPIEEAMQSLNAMINGTYRQSNSTVSRMRPTMGISGVSVKAGTSVTVGTTPYVIPHDGILVQSITDGSGAVGVLKVNDVIYALDNTLVKDNAALQNVLYGYEVGQTVSLRVWRAGQELELTLKLGVTAT